MRSRTPTPVVNSSRHRMYRCLFCGKEDRKGRLTGHILKFHVPADRVPYSCSLCNFRCTNKQDLVTHIREYKKHREEMAKMGTVDHKKVLTMSSNPVVIDAAYMSLVMQGGANPLATLLEDTLADRQSIFEPQDEPDDILLPDWLSLPEVHLPVSNLGSFRPVVPSTASNQNPVESGFTEGAASVLPLSPPAHTGAYAVPYHEIPMILTTQPTAAYPPATTYTSWTAPTSQLYTPQYAPQPVSTSTIPATVTIPSVTQVDDLSSAAPPAKKARPFETQTPLLDENDGENILDQLLKPTDTTDPLMVEATPPTSTADADKIAAAISEGTKKIAEALEFNSRAIKVQGQTFLRIASTLDKVVGELQRVERRLCGIERRGTDPENRHTSTPLDSIRRDAKTTLERKSSTESSRPSEKKSDSRQPLKSAVKHIK